MKQVNIWIDGVYDKKFKTAYWKYYLNYDKAVVKRVGETYLGDNYCDNIRPILEALNNGLKQFKEPCKIKVFSKKELSFNNYKNLKNNKDLIRSCVNQIVCWKHTVIFEQDTEFNRPSIWESLYSNKAKQELEKLNNRGNYRSSKEEIDKEKQKRKELEEEYAELLRDKGSTWVPGSGGY